MTPVSFPQDRQESNQGELEGQSSTPATTHRAPPSFAAGLAAVEPRAPFQPESSPGEDLFSPLPLLDLLV